MTWAWGVDVDTKGAHFGFVNMNSRAFQTNSTIWDGLNVAPARRLQECRAQVYRVAKAWSKDFKPMTIAVELPIAYRKPNPPLMMHTGVIAEALAAATGLAPWFVGIQEWRKAIGVGGNADKDKVVEWAKAKGWAHGRVDQAEALGIATAAGQIFVDGLGVAA